MKKLMIIFGLLLATSVAFGKPAYKQWKWEKMDYSVNRDVEVEGSYLRFGYMSFRHKTKKDGNVYIGLFADTNRLTEGKVRIMVTASTSEKVDFSVGSNSVYLICIGAGVTNTTPFKDVGVSDGRYSYFADVGWVDVRCLDTGTLFLKSFYKVADNFRLFDCLGLYKEWREEEVLRQRQSDVDAFIEYRDGLDDRYKALVKNYEVKYNGAIGGYSIWSKKSKSYTATRFAVCLSMKADGDMSFWRDSGHDVHNVVRDIQFQLVIPQVVSYFVDVGAIYTADGEYSLRYPFSFYNGEMFTEQGMSKARYCFDVIMTPRVVKESGKLEYLNKMFSSGKPIFIEFRGKVVGSMKYQLTAQDIAQVKDLLKFVNELQGGF